MRALLPLLAAALSSCAGARGAEVLPAIERLDPRFDALVPPGVRPERIAEGFGWVEGPLWNPWTGELLFSDVERNRVHAWSRANGVRTVLEGSGYTGSTPFAGREPGSNGLALDREGRLVFCQHGERRISRLEPDGTRTVLVERYQGKRLNSPNDLVCSRAGDLYFTDPPFGLPETYDDPGKELPFSGVYRLSASGDLTLLVDDLAGPNGIALAPDERTLYVANNDRARAVWMAYDLLPGGDLGPGRVLHDGHAWITRYRGLPDGMKVHRSGNLFCAGPEAIYVFAPDGTHLGSLRFGALTSNCALDADQRALFVTVDSAIYRLPLAPSVSDPGVGFQEKRNEEPPPGIQPW